MGSGTRLRTQGVNAVRRVCGTVWHSVVEDRLERIQYGPSPLAREWDLLVILDTCRVDALREVADEYSWLPDDVEAVRSPASWSKGWLEKACDIDQYSDVIGETAMVTWNPYTEQTLAAADWRELDEVWRYATDDTGNISPRTITDRTISVSRETDAERYISWYQQPHAPYRGIEVDRGEVWEMAKRGDIDRERLWNAMVDNLRWVLDDVELLLNNVDAERVVLTADHGEAFGEFGGLLWGHGPGLPVPSLVRVPWVELSAEDSGEYEPMIDQAEEEMPAKDHLEALGYL